VIWQTRIGRGGALGGIHWGIAADGRLAYVANSDWLDYGAEPNVPANPGLFALDLMNGEIVWKSTSDPRICRGKKGCYNSNSSAPSLIPGLVFAGSLDGYLRVHDAETGAVLWEFDTNQTFETVNQVEGHGGSIDGPGPVVANGMVFINSGYALFGEMPGNVLLAFGVE
jgi:polyvinyl alcohol dehydrogenase (cytochrome)